MHGLASATSTWGQQPYWCRFWRNIYSFFIPIIPNIFVRQWGLAAIQLPFLCCRISWKWGPLTGCSEGGTPCTYVSCMVLPLLSSSWFSYRGCLCHLKTFLSQWYHHFVMRYRHFEHAYRCLLISCKYFMKFRSISMPNSCFCTSPTWTYNA